MPHRATGLAFGPGTALWADFRAGLAREARPFSQAVPARGPLRPATARGPWGRRAAAGVLEAGACTPAARGGKEEVAAGLGAAELRISGEGAAQAAPSLKRWRGDEEG